MVPRVVAADLAPQAFTLRTIKFFCDPLTCAVQSAFSGMQEPLAKPLAT